MTAWGIFWICFFTCIAVDNISTSITRYKAYKYTIDHQVNASKKQIKDIID